MAGKNILFLKHNWSLGLLRRFTKTDQLWDPSPYQNTRVSRAASQVSGTGWQSSLSPDLPALRSLFFYHSSAKWARWSWITSTPDNTGVSLLCQSPICPPARLTDSCLFKLFKCNLGPGLKEFFFFQDRYNFLFEAAFPLCINQNQAHAIRGFFPLLIFMCLEWVLTAKACSFYNNTASNWLYL